METWSRDFQPTWKSPSRVGVWTSTRTARRASCAPCRRPPSAACAGLVDAQRAAGGAPRVEPAPGRCPSGEPVGQLGGRRGARHRDQAVQGAPVDVPGHRDLAAWPGSPCTAVGGRRAVVVVDVAGVPRDLAQPRLERRAPRRRRRRARGAAGPGRDRLRRGGVAAGSACTGSGTAVGAGRTGVVAGRATGEADGVALGSVTCTTRVACPPAAPVTRVTPYPSAEVPTSTPVTIATVATLFTPAPMVPSSPRTCCQSERRSGRRIGCTCVECPRGRSPRGARHTTALLG